MNFGLSKSTIEKISGFFSRHPQVERAILYGSQAKGHFKQGTGSFRA